MGDDLHTRLAHGGRVKGSQEEGFQFSMPAVPAGQYALAQVDDYLHLPRRKFPHQPPFRLGLEARVSSLGLPGTWGFGLWNDPFSFGIGGGGMARVLPVLPNAAWFFYGSSENCLTLRDDQPGSGFHAKTYRSGRLPWLLSILAVPTLPLLLWPAAARLIRKLARYAVKEASIPLNVPVDTWHTYSLLWMEDRSVFCVDNEKVLETALSPRGRLGLVIWIDNQYFRFDPEGKIGFGFQEVAEDQWLQVRNISLSSM